MKKLFVVLLALWPLVSCAAKGPSGMDAQLDKVVEEAAQHLKGMDPAELEAFSKVQQEAVMFALLLGRSGAYPIPECQWEIMATKWPLAGIEDGFKVTYPFVARVSIQARDGSYPQRILMFRRESLDLPWVITDHFFPNNDDSVKEKLAIPSPELQAKARAVMPADLNEHKERECNDGKK